MAFRQPVRSGSKTGGTAVAAKATGGREIPDKLYFRIGEVAKLCEVAPYVLRFWESEFPQLKPNKGGTGQRLYRRRDVEMALRVKTLLYDEGYTIAGARQYLKGELRAKDTEVVAAVEASSTRPDAQKLQAVRAEMQALLAMLSEPAVARARGGVVQSIRAVKAKSTAERIDVAGLFDNME